MAVPIAIDSTLTTTFSYFKVQPRHETEKPYEILINIPNLSIPRTNYASETVQCQVTDVRGRAEAYSLDTHGFTWRQLNTSVTDFRDRAQIEKIYLQEIHDSLLQELGSTIKKIHIFDWKVRFSQDMKDFRKRTINLKDGLDTLLPTNEPHIGIDTNCIEEKAG